MIAVLLALGASVGWGTSDFLGGLKARTVPLAAVLFVSQGIGLLAIGVFLALLGDPVPERERLLYSVGAGLTIVTGLGLLYLALARGPVIVAAPVAAVAATIPVVVGLSGGDPFSLPIAAGLACALLGSVAVAYEPTREASAPILASVPVALGAALSIGAFFVLFDAASEESAYWATGGMRLTGWLVSAGFLLAAGPGLATVTGLPRSVQLPLAAIGILSVLGDVAFAIASQEGNLSVVSVLASLYPVVTVMLAFGLLRERVHGARLAGVGLAFVGVVLLALEAG